MEVEIYNALQTKDMKYFFRGNLTPKRDEQSEDIFR
jgi:hypothetical protein